MKKESSIRQDVVTKFLNARKENVESFFAHPSYQLEQELLYWISQADEKNAKIALYKINNLERAKLSHSPLRSLKNSLICSCTLFTRATIQAGVAPEYAYDLSDIFIREIEKINETIPLKNLELVMVNTFIQAIRDYQKEPYHNEIVDRSVQYIHDHILQPLTLQEVADAINVNSNYLSSLFRKVVGIPLMEYVNRKKIEESKYFLRHTDSPLLDIALLFSYCNQSYYSSLFKRYNNLTPKQYRQRIT